MNEFNNFISGIKEIMDILSDNSNKSYYCYHKQICENTFNLVLKQVEKYGELENLVMLIIKNDKYLLEAFKKEHEYVRFYYENNKIKVINIEDFEEKENCKLDKCIFVDAKKCIIKFACCEISFKIYKDVDGKFYIHSIGNDNMKDIFFHVIDLLFKNKLSIINDNNGSFDVVDIRMEIKNMVKILDVDQELIDKNDPENIVKFEKIGYPYLGGKDKFYVRDNILYKAFEIKEDKYVAVKTDEYPRLIESYLYKIDDYSFVVIQNNDYINIITFKENKIKLEISEIIDMANKNSKIVDIISNISHEFNHNNSFDVVDNKGISLVSFLENNNIKYIIDQQDVDFYGKFGENFSIKYKEGLQYLNFNLLEDEYFIKFSTKSNNDEKTYSGIITTYKIIINKIELVFVNKEDKYFLYWCDSCLNKCKESYNDDYGVYEKVISFIKGEVTENE